MCHCGRMIDPKDKCRTCDKPKAPEPHKHAATIKAWADGATIQMLNNSNKWRDCPSPLWYIETEYRVKPVEKSYGEIAQCQFRKDGWDASYPTEAFQSMADAVISAFIARNFSLAEAGQLERNRK